MKNIILIILTVFITVGFISCTKEETGKATFRVKLTDDPAAYDEVNVEIIGVEVHSDVDGWQPLAVNSGIYNLLDYVNGADTLIASNDIAVGTVSQIRLLLGDNNTIKVNNQVYPLETPSGQQSGLKINIHAVLEDGVTYIVLLDFDAAKSVNETGNGKYILKPVIKAIAQGIDGVIRGEVDPAASSPIVYAIMGTDTTTTSADTSGHFMVQGLAGGTYTVIIEPVAPYKTETITNVGVTVGNITDLGTIQITQ